MYIIVVNQIFFVDKKFSMFQKRKKKNKKYIALNPVIFKKNTVFCVVDLINMFCFNMYALHICCSVVWIKILWTRKTIIMDHHTFYAALIARKKKNLIRLKRTTEYWMHIALRSLRDHLVWIFYSLNLLLFDYICLNDIVVQIKV